ncbi:LysM peptidoglycan-binding domain-containing protein [Spirosoma sp. KCTC 42546]|uniref:CIS tube protein n=1 Tax=Spirosoma sp. KCTC 42546 TaxID=2520506 RepID=UPI001158FD95|nr:LysM peptidoglycan-binding domain-containing protein [Spirosoma sp. KCTC 42546]QDK82118.1 LysM peptidoglycan-binding domain-containing protein [Spirosoma sp. KCTC 42546]
MLGELAKMKLTGYQDVGFTKRTGDEYTALVNPETYTLNYEIQSNQEQASGTSANQPTFNRISPRKLDFEFLFDSTGALTQDVIVNPFAAAANQGVWEQVEQLKKTVFNFIGQTHQPPYVELAWGKLIFKCKAEKVSITYKLFKPDGTPIRAVAKVSFIEVIPDDTRVRKEKTESPDLTHVRTVQEGDTLPMMCYRIYGDSALYWEVAHVNKLLNFRKLTTGQRLFFPPIDKESKL